MSLARFAFQASTFNHSAISPFKNNDLRSLKNQNSGIVISPPMCRDHLRAFPV
jgi:hypothetical protein